MESYLYFRWFDIEYVFFPSAGFFIDTTYVPDSANSTRAEEQSSEHLKLDKHSTRDVRLGQPIEQCNESTHVTECTAISWPSFHNLWTIW